MKKIIWIGLLFWCWGCSPAMGTLDKETLDLNQVSQAIDAKITDGEWPINVLGDPLSASAVADIYGISADQYDEAMVRRSLIEAAGEEIAIFHAVDHQEEAMIEQLRQYQRERLKESEALPVQQHQIQNAYIGQIGHYVILVCSQEQANVIQYINTLR